MSDDPVREPFANPLPPVPKTEEEIEAERQAERDAAEAAAKEAAENPPPPPQPLTDDKVYTAPSTADPKVTHAAMSSEELEALGYDADGNPAGEPKTVEPEQPQEEEEL